MSSPRSTPTVRDNPGRSRYEIYDGEQLAGFTTYKLENARIALLHTEILPELGGRGLGRKLVTDELEDARRRRLAVLPFCPYVTRVIAQNPDAYLELVPDADRNRFGLSHIQG